MNQLVQAEPRFTAPDAAELSPSREDEALSVIRTAALNGSSQAAAGGVEPATVESDDSLFEHFAWLYAFFREHLFRDDTNRIIRALWPTGIVPAKTSVIELGCGPGFYSCGLAARFPTLDVLGIDRSARQLAWAEKKAAARRLDNCRFESDDVLDLSHTDNSYDVVLAARLFTVLPDQERAIAEMHRVLRPGGRCLIAEPRYAFWASLPLLTMWLLAGVMRMKNGYCEPRHATVLSAEAFKNLFASQPWRQVRTWQEGRYQYALCEKV